MEEKKSPLPDKYAQVKGILRTLKLDQDALADKFGIKQASISKALNGANEKTFKKIVQLLENEYGVNSLNQHLESGVAKDIAEIKAELAEIKAAVARIEAHLNKR
jgi:transcriptional regulator with XRE-family HTH domain